MQEAPTGNVGLDPLAIQHELRDSSLAGPLDYFLGGAGNFFNVHFFVGNLMLRQPALSDVAITAPWSGIDGQVNVFQGNL